MDKNYVRVIFITQVCSYVAFANLDSRHPWLAANAVFIRRMDMSTISLRVPEKELNIFKAYAKHNNSTLSEIIRITMLERIEDEYDLKVFEEYESEKQAGTLKTRPINELWKELEL